MSGFVCGTVCCFVWFNLWGTCLCYSRDGGLGRISLLCSSGGRKLLLPPLVRCCYSLYVSHSFILKLFIYSLICAKLYRCLHHTNPSELIPTRCRLFCWASNHKLVEQCQYPWYISSTEVRSLRSRTRIRRLATTSYTLSAISVVYSIADCLCMPSIPQLLGGDL